VLVKTPYKGALLTGRKNLKEKEGEKRMRCTVPSWGDSLSGKALGKKRKEVAWAQHVSKLRQEGEQSFRKAINLEEKKVFQRGKKKRKFIV